MWYFLYRLEIFLVSRLSLTNAYRFARFYAWVWYLFGRGRKKNIQKNLETLYHFQGKTLSPQETRKLVFSTMYNFAKYLVEVFKTSQLTPQNIQEIIDPNNVDIFTSLLNEGKGVIVYTAHFGNWELAGIALSHYGYPFTTVALPQKDPRLDKLFDQMRLKFGIQQIPWGLSSGKQCLKALRQNKILVLLADEDYSGNGVEIDFLGKPHCFPSGPALLSRASGAPLVPGILIRLPDNRFRIQVMNPVYPVRTNNQEEDIRQMTQLAMESLLPFYIQHPDQWFRFR